MNRGQLIGRVAAKASLATDTGHEELGFMQDWANEAVVDVLLRTHCYVDIGDMTLSTGVGRYRTDNNILAVLDAEVTSGGNPIDYTVISLEEMLDRERITSAADGATFIAHEGTLMVVFPAPTSTTKIQFLYVPRPTKMTQDSHDPSTATYGGVQEEYHRALEYYMLWQAAEYDEKRTEPLSAKDYRLMYESECQDVRKRKRAKASRRLGPARIGPPGARQLARRNDTYPER
jgi:hypothetical protein